MQLVDVSDAKGVERITENAVVANGVAYEVDCIIYATGFEITTSAHRRVDFDTIGRNGESLYDHWKDGYRTLHGLTSHGFPNWFTIGINQNGLSPNMTAMFDDQAVHVAYIVDTVKKRGKQAIEATADAEDAWVKQIVALAGFGAQAFLEAVHAGLLQPRRQRQRRQHAELAVRTGHQRVQRAAERLARRGHAGRHDDRLTFARCSRV